MNWATLNSISGKYPQWLYDYWCDFLYKRLESAYEFNIPDTWDYDYVFDNLFIHSGFLSVYKDKRFGVVPQLCTLCEMNIFDRPVSVNVNKSVMIGTDLYTIDRHLIIDKDCVILKPFRDYSMFFKTTIQEFGHRLSVLAPSIDISLLNSRMAYVFGAKDKASAETIKDIMDKVYNGKPAVIYDKVVEPIRGQDEPWNFIQMNPNSAYLVDRLLGDYDTILRQFDEIIGLPTQPNKKERLITTEAEQQTINTFAIARMVTSNLNEQGRKIKELFGVDFSVKLKGDEQNAKSKDDSDGVRNSDR